MVACVGAIEANNAPIATTAAAEQPTNFSTGMTLLQESRRTDFVDRTQRTNIGNVPQCFTPLKEGIELTPMEQILRTARFASIEIIGGGRYGFRQRRSLMA